MPRELFIACAAVCVIAPIFAAILERTWTLRHQNVLELQSSMEGLR